MKTDPTLTARPGESPTHFAIRCIKAEAWDEGYQHACDETPSGYAPAGPSDVQNPYRDMGDEWCREETCRYRHCRSGSMPTHRRGSECPAVGGAR